MRNKYLLVLFSSLLWIACNDEQAAGPGETDTYIKFFGANNADIAYMSQPTADGGHVLLGTTEIELEGVESSKIKVIKVDNNGNKIWQKVYPPFLADKSDLETSFIGRSIIVVSDGYIIVGDSIKSDESTTCSLLVMKLNDTAIDDNPPTLAIDHIDNFQINSGGGLHGVDITLDTDGNYRVIGNVIKKEEIAGSWIGTVNDNGNTLSFDPNINCYYDIEGEVALVKSLYETSSGNFVFGGTNKSQSIDNAIIYEAVSCQNGFINGGVVLVNNPQDHYETGQIIPTKNGYAMVGTRTNAISSDVFFSLLENNGVPKPGSLKIFNNLTSEGLQGIGDNDEFGLTIASTVEGGFIIGGYTLSETAGEEDILLIKTDAFGGIQWTKTIGNTNQEEATHIQQAADGGYFIFGNTEFGGKDTMVLIKTDKNGNVN